MFCSKCGKSIDPSAQQCPACGCLFDEIRMGGFTSVQKIFSPGESAPEKSKYTPYTRLSYSTSEENEEEDVYSRTTYRPALEDEEAPAEPEQEMTEAVPEQEEAPAEESAEAAPAQEDPEEEEEPLAPIELPELKKAVKKGISPELEEAMRKMQEETKSKKDGFSLKGLSTAAMTTKKKRTRTKKTRRPKRPKRKRPKRLPRPRPKRKMTRKKKLQSLSAAVNAKSRRRTKRRRKRASTPSISRSDCACSPCWRSSPSVCCWWTRSSIPRRSAA